MTNADPIADQKRIINALKPLQGGYFHPSPKMQEVIAERLAKHLLPQQRRNALNEAIEAARGEYLHDDTATPEGKAYNQAVSDVVAAIGALLEGK